MTSGNTKKYKPHRIMGASEQASQDIHMAIQRLALFKVQAAYSKGPKQRWLRRQRVEEAKIELEKAEAFSNTVKAAAAMMSRTIDNKAKVADACPSSSTLTVGAGPTSYHRSKADACPSYHDQSIAMQRYRMMKKMSQAMKVQPTMTRSMFELHSRMLQKRNGR
mmetsp:Transcript_36071/g.77748  ORF Transcript_36071/g.77748 Transcript_36071/m.77748 type:complete len:164 (+) Transcript_36071:139-630(+)|eukprot:CAMPEP_0196132780 /NCGR_PEP_ID=MMETSP0910-20130528/2264_1 /TAXON_ID=49265 /ORGANISM="Thalassiosira rotula, Strain GSO102" /LENGTH=163 /DNA_ID=CAMNT_0041392419 /DNA_START=18 /DNA_END=509 /DNA_ORIENTATION=+